MGIGTISGVIWWKYNGVFCRADILEGGSFDGPGGNVLNDTWIKRSQAKLRERRRGNPVFEWREINAKVVGPTESDHDTHSLHYAAPHISAARMV